MQQPPLLHAIINLADSNKNTAQILEETIAVHPYFALAHLYALHNSKPDHNNYTTLATKTNLFFNSPFLLESKLHELSETEKLSDVKESPTETEVVSISNEHVSTILSNNIPEETASLIAGEHLNSTKEIQSAEDSAAIEDENTIEIAEETDEKKPIEKEIINIEEEPKKSEDEPLILFEPLHASDYFASQGIKLSDDVLGSDKLGKQLKSFTAWLKTMKKVHPEKLPEVTAALETAVKSQAEISNIDEEIVTEAMAEAYVIQEKKEKARDIYTKLSLINPAKSAYFAAKIDSLK